MKKRLVFIFGGIVVVVALTLAIQLSYSSSDSLLFANIEALTQGEVLPGKECRYQGSTIYGDYILCTASYPNIGQCGTRIKGYYSSDTGQCYE